MERQLSVRIALVGRLVDIVFLVLVARNRYDVIFSTADRNQNVICTANREGSYGRVAEVEFIIAGLEAAYRNLSAVVLERIFLLVVSRKAVGCVTLANNRQALLNIFRVDRVNYCGAVKSVILKIN